VKPDYSIRVLMRAAEILNCFTAMEPKKSLVSLASETGLHKSTVYRILETLEELNWVRREEESGLYRLGVGIFELGSRAVSGLDFYNVSRPFMDDLVNLTGQSVHLVVHDNGEALYLNKIEKPGAFITQPSSVGFRLPLHCTAVGKVLLAFMSKEEVEAIIQKKGLPRFTEKTIVNKDDLLRALSEVRSKGYAIDDEEIKVGLRCVAAPIKGHIGNVLAAISVSGLSSYFNDEKLPELCQVITGTARKISSELGCPSHAL